MRKYLLIVTSILVACGVAVGQEKTKVAGVLTTFNNETAKNFLFENEDVRITLGDAYIKHISLNIYNKTDKSLELNWKDTFYVINGNSEPVINLSTIDLGALSGVNQNGNLSSQKIGAKSNAVVKFGSRNIIFDSKLVEKEFKKSGTNLVNKLVLNISKDNTAQEYPINIEQYSKKNK
ncbi:hypothetical protein ACR79M_08430 [Sphingobacterium spiritivorum]|uniref:hypothetical protein n=1 Tax=Sphingobacterium spiritivorum TaxID=258 RepID=UPI003DA5F681